MTSGCNTEIEPLILEAAGEWDAGDELTVAAFDPDHDDWLKENPNGFVSISVAEEQAVSSYNATVESRIVLTKEQTTQLHDWLTKRLLARP